MSRSTVREPLFLSVSKKTPLTVHIRPTSTRSTTNQGEKVSERSSRRDNLRPAPSSTSRSSQRRGAGPQARGTRSSRSLSSRTKTSFQSLHPKLSWEGSTHRLEIHPPSHSRTGGRGGEEGERGEGWENEREHTTLRMSDLGKGGEEGEEEVECEADEHANFESRIQSLQSEVDTLAARLEEETQRHHQSLPLTQSSIRRHNETGEGPGASPEMRVLGQVASLMSSQLERQRREEERAARQRREELVRRLEEVEREGCAVRDHVDQLHTSLKKLGKRQSTSAVMSQLGGQRSKLMESVTEFKRGSRHLRKLLKQQLDHESCRDHLTQSATTADPHLTLHTQSLHDEIGRRDVELQSLMMHMQSLEEQLEKRDQEFTDLQTDLYEYKRKAGQEKAALKRAAKQHRQRAMESEKTAGMLAQELEETRRELTQMASERTRQDTELSSLSMRVRDLDNCLTQSIATAESAVGAVSAQLSEKTRELNLLQMENDRLKTTLETIEGALKVMEQNSSRKITSLEEELAQTRATSSQYEALSQEYKAQLERSRLETEEAQMEVRRRERDMERLQQDASTEMEKCRLKFEQQLAELEPLPQLLKMSEQRVQEVHQRASVCEQRAVEQSRLADELSTKYERQAVTLEEMRHRCLEMEAENRTLQAKLETANRRVEESDSQNRDLVATARHREESVHRLQCQLEESQTTVASLQAQLHSAASESRRQQEHIKDKAAGKERAHAARIADLESQLTKSNSLNTQLRRSKDEAERLHNSRLRSLQEQLDTANASRRSMETYINFLKVSYSSLCSEAGSHTAPPFHMLS